MSELEQEKYDLYKRVCRELLEREPLFRCDPFSKDRMFDHMCHAAREMNKYQNSSAFLERISELMATDIVYEHIDFYDMPDHYEEAVIQIKTDRITTLQELKNFLDEHDQKLESTEGEEDYGFSVGEEVEVGLDEKICSALTKILLKPEAPLCVTGISGIVGHVDPGDRMVLTRCRIMAETKPGSPTH